MDGRNVGVFLFDLEKNSLRGIHLFLQLRGFIFGMLGPNCVMKRISTSKTYIILFREIFIFQFHAHLFSKLSYEVVWYVDLLKGPKYALWSYPPSSPSFEFSWMYSIFKRFFSIFRVCVTHISNLNYDWGCIPAIHSNIHLNPCHWFSPGNLRVVKNKIVIEDFFGKCL